MASVCCEAGPFRMNREMILKILQDVFFHIKVIFDFLDLVVEACQHEQPIFVDSALLALWKRVGATGCARVQPH